MSFHVQSALERLAESLALELDCLLDAINAGRQPKDEANQLKFDLERMTELADRFINPAELELRALQQAGRELLLAQASDWPFILRTGTSPNYARKRVKDHLLRFIAIHEQLTTTRVDEKWLGQIEAMDNLFPDVDYRYWATLSRNNSVAHHFGAHCAG